MIEIEKEEKEDEEIKVSFPYNSDYIAKIKTIQGYKWNPKDKYWSIPYSKLEDLLSTFDGEKLVVDPSLYVDSSLYFEGLRKELVSRRYSRRTAKLYIHYNEDFLKFVKKTPYDISNDDIRDYLCYLAEERNVSTSTLNVTLFNLFGIVIKINARHDK